MNEKNNVTIVNVLKMFIIVIAVVFGVLTLWHYNLDRKDKEYLDSFTIDPDKGVSSTVRGIHCDTTKNDTLK
ncbi:MAG TPA: hypothetical protein VMV77_08955 [Bacteroidales bacterium]|nr:hypothetical protein [Bacteroidales bacterium]